MKAKLIYDGKTAEEIEVENLKEIEFILDIADSIDFGYSIAVGDCVIHTTVKTGLSVEWEKCPKSIKTLIMETCEEVLKSENFELITELEAKLDKWCKLIGLKNSFFYRYANGKISIGNH